MSDIWFHFFSHILSSMLFLQSSGTSTLYLGLPDWNQITWILEKWQLKEKMYKIDLKISLKWYSFQIKLNHAKLKLSHLKSQIFMKI